MIKFDRLWRTKKKKGVSTCWLREKCGIDRKTIRRLRANENTETKTPNKRWIALWKISQNIKKTNLNTKAPSIRMVPFQLHFAEKNIFSTPFSVKR